MRLKDLDELAPIFFPGNKNQQRIFVAIFVEIKWSEEQFLPALEPVADKYGLSHRVMETVRAKMRRLGLIEHVCRFNHRHGNREGWIFSRKFSTSLTRLAETTEELKITKSVVQEKKDRDLFMYI